MQTKYWVAPRFGDLELADIEVPAPGPGEVTIDIRAVGMNPTDFKAIAPGGDPSRLPIRIGQEIAGVIAAVGPSAGAHAVGDEVLAFRVQGGYAQRLTVPARTVFAKPPSLPFPEAANLLLAGTTAADMMRVIGVQKDDHVLVHGASGAVGVALLQLLRIAGARAIGTASATRADVVRRFGGTPVEYGSGLADRVRALAPDGVDASFDCVGTDEALDVSLELVPEPSRIVTIAASARARREGMKAVAGADPESAVFRDSQRQRLIDLAGAGDLIVPVARTFPFADAREALKVLRSGHPGGKLALII
ncbi:NADP-dependent oxidoreductase [Actinoplanes sp. TBRC 11911]|uniref:NADP-dependent oxidoreductase n=1 Tax=Actinoplanes sp. TBRC 11911 TaxID=2729386 RepID=UPI00145DCB32|nr:NADP-dependent oxidoreductase [Actinoplanes sp. TBRC 11911]NMO52852.1 NADP-dependent oxidoreductase [Actinoplanes sp. TBRC 11911]